MKLVNKPEEKIGKIIFSRILSMPMAQYREYIASVCGAPAATEFQRLFWKITNGKRAGRRDR